MASFIKPELLAELFDEYGEVHAFVYGLGASWGLTEIGNIPSDDANQLREHYVYFVGGRWVGRIIQAILVILGAAKVFNIPL